MHALKTIPQYFEKILSGEKTFEIRKYDRPFKTGDIIILQEWDEGYTGKEIQKKISHIFVNESKMGLKDGYCIISLFDLPDQY